MRACVFGLCLLVTLQTAGCSIRGRKSEPEEGTAAEAKDEEPGKYGPLTPGERPVNPLMAPRMESRIQVTVDDHEMTRSRAGGFWLIPKPVSDDPTVRFTTDLKPIDRVYVFVTPCDAEGRDTGQRTISIIDPSRRTLTPGSAFRLAAPAGCVISGERSLRRIAFRSGGTYMLKVRVESAGAAEVVSVLFNVR